MHTKSLKLPPLSSSSAKGHTGKHEEHARNHEDLLALWMLALKAARLNWSLQSTLCFIACTALLCSLQYFYKCSLWERGSSWWVVVRFHELKNVLTVNNVPPHRSLPLDPFLQSSVEFELIRTFTKNFSEIFDTERERDPHFRPLVVPQKMLDAEFGLRLAHHFSRVRKKKIWFSKGQDTKRNLPTRFPVLALHWSWSS